MCRLVCKIMLKHRLIFGTIMAAALALLLYLDSRIAFSRCNAEIAGVVFAAMVALITIVAQFEMASLCRQKNCKVFLAVSIPCSILLSLSFFFGQFGCEGKELEVVLWLQLSALTLATLGSFFSQARTGTTEGTIANCGATLLSVLYLGFLASFVMAIRIDFGIAVLLMYIFTIKSSDIGAYTLGRLFGKRKFAPSISPGKTWEGMGGACLFAAIVGALFAISIEGLSALQGVIFGIIFAFAGQLGDLAESMLKRDSQMKDSGAKLPGFGGVLDVLDSPVAAAAAAYLFFSICL